jgi:hypothetical protein
VTVQVRVQFESGRRGEAKIEAFIKAAHAATAPSIDAFAKAARATFAPIP